MKQGQPVTVQVAQNNLTIALKHTIKDGGVIKGSEQKNYNLGIFDSHSKTGKLLIVQKMGSNFVFDCVYVFLHAKSGTTNYIRTVWRDISP